MRGSQSQVQSVYPAMYLKISLEDKPINNVSFTRHLRNENKGTFAFQNTDLHNVQIIQQHEIVLTNCTYFIL